MHQCQTSMWKEEPIVKALGVNMATITIRCGANNSIAGASEKMYLLHRTIHRCISRLVPIHAEHVNCFGRTFLPVNLRTEQLYLMTKGRLNNRLNRKDTLRMDLPRHSHMLMRRNGCQKPRRKEEEDEWRNFDFVDPDIGYEDPLDQRIGFAEHPPVRRPSDYRASRRPVQFDAEPFDEDEYADEEEYEDERAARRHKAKKRKLTRRRLLWGLGLGAVAAGGVAAYELAPKLPQALEGVGTNIEKQLQDAYSKGIAAGEEAVRKEFLNALDDMEGISLQAAIGSARLTRLAYDAFVSPLVTLAATITGDFLSIILNALITGRGWLSRIGQDNDTLAAIQTVLETWKQKVTELPMELQSITDADLDGAQSYLRALQRKIQQEQAKLNSAATPTTTSSAAHPSTPTTKPSGTRGH